MAGGGRPQPVATLDDVYVVDSSTEIFRDVMYHFEN